MTIEVRPRRAAFVRVRGSTGVKFNSLRSFRIKQSTGRDSFEPKIVR